MVCIYCSANTQVINSRPQKRSNQIWRRRQCTACTNVFTTEESVAYGLAWLVESKHGLQPFSRDKLFISLHRSLQHRPSATADAGALSETIIKKLLNQVVKGRINSRIISQAAQVTLNRFDNAASVHYQAFHSRHINGN